MHVVICALVIAARTRDTEFDRDPEAAAQHPHCAAAHTYSSVGGRSQRRQEQHRPGFEYWHTRSEQLPLHNTGHDAGESQS